ncbi:MAG: hypothetical protein PHV51_10630, partial [Methanosarcinaceae archaeon]|nr:hypothetical protein [Methanosarcinaceae archaeon]
TNNAGKSYTDSINITVKTEGEFITDFDGGDGITLEDIRSVRLKYESGEVSGPAAVKVIGKAYNVSYEEALALLGINS